MTFDDLISAPQIRRAVAALGWTHPTPIQRKAIPLAREGRDVVGIAQTGTGKTGAFLIPCLERQIGLDALRTLVICPTRELAQQVAADARDLGREADLSVAEIVGGVSIGGQIRDLKAGCQVVAATPGRLLDHLERGTLRLDDVKTLILDEADRMLDMGFRPQIEAVLKQLPRDRQTMLFSATMPNGVHALALRIMKDPERIEAAPPATLVDKVEQRVYSVRAERKPALLVELLREEDWSQVLVFTATKVGADVLLARLRAVDISADVLHGDRDMRERGRALSAFAEGRVRVLVATDVAQRGLDIDGISHVVNYDVPRQPEDYIHRIGRTARAGASGTAVTFVSAVELGAMRDIEIELGGRLARISLPGFCYDDPSDCTRPSRPVAQVSRTGGRMGTRSADDLSPEELAALLSTG